MNSKASSGTDRIESFAHLVPMVLVTVVWIVGLVLFGAAYAGAAGPAFGARQDAGTHTYDRTAHAAMDAPGNLLLTSTSSNAVIGPNSGLVYSDWKLIAQRRTASGRMLAPEVVSGPQDPANTPFYPTTASNPAGDVVTAFDTYPGNEIRIVAGTARDGYGAVVKRTISGDCEDSPAVAVSENGTAIIAFNFATQVGAQYVEHVGAIYRDKAGNFSQPVTLPIAVAQYPNHLAVDINDKGEIGVTFTDSSEAFVARGTVASGIGPVLKLPDIYRGQAIKFADDGRLVIVGSTQQDDLEMTTLDSTNYLSNPQNITETPFGFQTDVTATRDEEGHVVFAWLRSQSSDMLRFVRYSGSSGLGPVRTINSPTDSGSHLGVTARAGAILFAWSQGPPYVGQPVGTIQAAYWSPTSNPAQSTTLQSGVEGMHVSPALDLDGDAVVFSNSWNAPHGKQGDSVTTDLSLFDYRIHDFPPEVAPDVAPVLSAVSLARKKFAACSGEARTGCGTKLKFTLSEAATVKVSIDRKVSRKVRGGDRKTQLRKAGNMSFINRTAGKNKVQFTGKLKRKLKPGKYRMTVIATDAEGAASKKSKLTFRVAKPRRGR